MRATFLGNTFTSRGGKEVSPRSHKPEVVSSNLTRDCEFFLSLSLCRPKHRVCK